ncbi:MAG: DUF6879 family protein [Actinophytocola sp.]|uniref:DUF6879 family protein n=1 Tax=Actinophytocola sp. TaxID=1872138 RepID=UPI003C71A3DA
MRLDGDAWREFFDSFTQEAFRLETLPAYRVGSEQGEYEKFLRTGELNIPDDDAWLTRVRHFRKTGRTVRRVHLISWPLTDYLRYEFSVYRYTVAAGEDVRIMDTTNHPDVRLPDHDYWLFDNEAVVRMDYSTDGTQLGRELLENIDPATYIAWKELALLHSKPFSAYDLK